MTLVFNKPATTMTRRWLEDDSVHLDLRGLEAPQPAVMILREIEGGEIDFLTVHMDREPLFLFSELIERGWSWLVVGRGGAPSQPGAGLPDTPPQSAPVTLVLKKASAA